MKQKRELAKFLADRIDETYNHDEGCEDMILKLLVEFEETKEVKEE